LLSEDFDRDIFEETVKATGIEPQTIMNGQSLRDFNFTVDLRQAIQELRMISLELGMEPLTEIK